MFNVALRKKLAVLAVACVLYGVSIPSALAATTKNIDFWTGVAMTAKNYSIGRDADAPNQLHFNVPTGAGMEFSINDVGKMVLNSSGYFGVGTTSPLTRFTVADTGTSTLTIDTTSTTQGACLEYKDRDGSGYTYVTYNNGAQYVSSTSCK